MTSFSPINGRQLGKSKLPHFLFAFLIFVVNAILLTSLASAAVHQIVVNNVKTDLNYGQAKVRNFKAEPNLDVDAEINSRERDLRMRIADSDPAGLHQNITAELVDVREEVSAKFTSDLGRVKHEVRRVAADQSSLKVEFARVVASMNSFTAKMQNLEERLTAKLTARAAENSVDFQNANTAARDLENRVGELDHKLSSLTSSFWSSAAQLSSFQRDTNVTILDIQSNISSIRGRLDDVTVNSVRSTSQAPGPLQVEHTTNPYGEVDSGSTTATAQARSVHTSTRPGATIRLRGENATDSEGRVEIFRKGVWGTVCDDDWDIDDATVVCRQLGYPRALSAPGRATYGRGTGPILIDDVRCRGSEAGLQNCSFTSRHDCDHGEDASVSCATIRLRGENATHSQGRVEIYQNGVWGTVCDDDWDMNDATVACRQLGYSHALSARGQAAYGQGTGPVLLDNVQCRGSEAKLQYCSSTSQRNSYCGHHEDASVSCATIRLRGEITTHSEGRVEVFQNGVWSRVCGDHWNINQATVVCRQLGYSRALSAPRRAAYGQGTGPILRGSVLCGGSEAKLQDCDVYGYHRCGHGKYASVSCATIRLGGDHATNSEGRVEVFQNGVWGTVCDNGWDIDDATVVCRQLGYSHALSTPRHAAYGQGTGPILMDDVQCCGSEAKLQYCPSMFKQNSNCGHHEYASVSCATIRLRGEITTHSEGRVEVLQHGVWGTVCDDNWDITDATVVCKQLGYSRALSAPGRAAYGRGTGPILMSDVRCRGFEAKFQDCLFSERHNNCDHDKDASVSCG